MARKKLLFGTSNYKKKRPRKRPGRHAKRPNKNNTKKNTRDRAEGEFFNLDIYPIIPYI